MSIDGVRLLSDDEWDEVDWLWPSLVEAMIETPGDVGAQ